MITDVVPLDIEKDGRPEILAFGLYFYVLDGNGRLICMCDTKAELSFTDLVGLKAMGSLATLPIRAILMFACGQRRAQRDWLATTSRPTAILATPSKQSPQRIWTPTGKMSLPWELTPAWDNSPSINPPTVLPGTTTSDLRWRSSKEQTWMVWREAGYAGT